MSNLKDRLLYFVIAAAILSGLIASALRSHGLVVAGANKSLAGLTRNLNGQLLALTNGVRCEGNGSGGHCYNMQTAILLVDYPPSQVNSQLLKNLIQNGWTRDGQPFDQSPTQTKETEIHTDQNGTLSSSAASLALLTPTFFGENDLLKKGNSAAYVFVWGDDKHYSDDAALYLLRSEIPASSSFDFNKIAWTPFKSSTHKTILAISASD